MLMNVAIMSGQRGRFDGGKGTQSAAVRPHVLVAGSTMVVEAGALRKRLAALWTGVGLVPRVHSGMGLECGRLTEGLAADFAAIRPLSVVFAAMADHGGFVTKSLVAHRALVGFLSRVLSKVVVEVHPRFKGFITRRAGKVSNVLVV